ncbi:MAG TPA: DUF6152 family protein [Burkholderiales bacterium]|nr:DUF6152 family protein [Burkholderiales bacterium]
MRRIVLAFLLAVPAGALAHHGWSEYDTGRAMKLSGTVVESGYEHPHGHVRLETPGKTWHVVLAPPSRMERRGLPKQALARGAELSVEGYPHRDKPDELRAERIHVGGKTIELR